MGLQIKRSTHVKVRILSTVIAAFALIAQPMYGVLASHVANALSNTDSNAEITAVSSCKSGVAVITITGKNKSSKQASGTYTTTHGEEGAISADAGKTATVTVNTGGAHLDAGTVTVKVTSPVSLTYEAHYDARDCAPTQTTPTDGETLTGTVQLDAVINNYDVSDTAHVTFTKSGDTASAFDADMTNKGGQHWQVSVDTTKLSNGTYTVKFSADKGKIVKSVSNVTINNDTKVVEPTNATPTTVKSATPVSGYPYYMLSYDGFKVDDATEIIQSAGGKVIKLAHVDNDANDYVWNNAEKYGSNTVKVYYKLSDSWKVTTLQYDTKGNLYTVNGAPITGYVDNAAPTATLKLSGGNIVNGVRYVRPSDKLTAMVTAQESGNSGLDRASYAVFSVANNGHQLDTICGGWHNGHFSANSNIASNSFTMTDCNGGVKPVSGTYAIGFRVYDNAGNYVRLDNVRFTVDGNGPTMSDFEIEGNSPYTKTINVSAKASDTISLSNVKFFVTDTSTRSNGETYCTGNGKHLAEADGQQAGDRYKASLDDISSLTGKFCVSAQAADSAMNHSNIIGRKLVTIDNTAPTLSNVKFSKPGTTYIKDGNGIYVTFTASEPLQNLPTVKFDSISAQTVKNTGGNNYAAYLWMDGNLPEGSVMLSINYTDMAGNVGKTVTGTTDNSQVIVDRTPPAASITSVSQTSKNTVTVSGKVSDHNLNYYYCYLTTNQTITVDGYTFTPGQEVKLHNNTDSTRNSRCNTTWAHGSTELSDNLGGFDITGLPSGSYTVNLVAYDLAKNINANNPTTYQFAIDHTAPTVPTITIGSAQNGQQKVAVSTDDSSDTFTRTFRYGDGSTVDPSLITNNGNTYTMNTSQMQKGTKITVSAIETDHAGNSSATATSTFTVNNSSLAPVVMISEPVLQDDGNYKISGLVNGNFVPGASVTVVVVSANSTRTFTPLIDNKGSWSFSTALNGDTNYTITASTSDQYNYDGQNTITYTTASVQTDAVVVPASQTRLTRSFAAIATPAVFGAQTQQQALQGVGNGTNGSSDTGVLGAQDTKGNKGVLGDTATLASSSQGWKILGFAWYWWLLLIAAVLALWWFLAARRRASENA